MASSSSNTTNKDVVVALVGATGRAGGWVLEECLARGYPVVALVRSASKLAAYGDRISIVEGDATDPQAMERLLSFDRNGTSPQVVISTIGSPNKETLVVEAAANALVTALQSTASTTPPRVIWMTSTGINEATDQAKSYPLFGKQPSQWFFGHGLFGWLQFKILIPYVIGQNVWDDMAHSETVLRTNDNIIQRTVLVRPGNMKPVSEAPTFSDQWKKEGGDDTNYVLVKAEDPPPGIWIVKRAIAAALVDLIQDTSRDGSAVSVFQAA